MPEPHASRLHTGLTISNLLEDPDGRASPFQIRRRLPAHGRYEHGKRYDPRADRIQSSQLCVSGIACED